MSTLAGDITRTQDALTAARAAGDTNLAADLLGKLCTLRDREAREAKLTKTRTRTRGAAPTQEDIDTETDRRQAAAEEAANTPITGFEPATNVISLDSHRKR